MPDTSTRPMSRTEIAMRVRGIIAEHIGREVSEAAMFHASVDFGRALTVEIGLALEDAFGLHLTWADADALTEAATVGGLIDLLEGHLKAGGIA